MAAVTLTTVAIGAAIGAGVGAVATYAAGGRGDALWKGALVGAVSGAVTAGVGSWAGAGAGGWAGAGAGALAGGAGGVTAGVLGTALNGGNRSDYLKNSLFGGLGGAALGAVGGALSGGNALPADANGIPTTADGSYAFDDAVAGSVVDPNAASSLSGGTVGTSGGTAAIDPTLATTTVSQPTTTPALQDTVNTLSNNQYAAAPTSTMTDIGGSSATPQELPGGVPLTDTSNTVSGSGLKMPSGSSYSLENGFNIPDQTGLQPTGQVGIEVPKSATEYTPFTEEGQAALKGIPNYKQPGAYDVSAYKAPEPSMWDKLTGIGSKKMGDMTLGDYMKMQGMGSLLSGGVKTVGALSTAGETQANRNALMDLYNQQNTQNQYYNQKLQSTYDNPEEYLNSPEAVASRQLAMQKLLAQNAMAGRRTAGLATQQQLMMNQLANLNAYRQGMPRTQYGTAADIYNKGAAYSPTGDITTGLSSMFTPLSMYALMG